MNGVAPPDRKRIVVLTSTFPRWEGDREPPFVFELSKRLAERFHVTVLAPHAPAARLHEQMAQIEVRRFRYFFTRWQRLAYDGGILANLRKNRWRYLLVPLFMMSEIACLARFLSKNEIDAIHAHWLIPQGLAAIAARAIARRGKPAIICTSHGGDLFGLSGKVLTWVKRQVIRRVDRLTVVSHAMREFARTLHDRNDIEVISMGVDLKETFTPAPDSRRSDNELLSVGRLVEKKGVRYLIMAMPEILQTHPRTRLLIAGDGPERTQLQCLADDLGIASRVEFLGPVENAALRDLYRRAAIFVAPSIVAQGGDQEGLGLVLVEALGCECPVLASDLPAIRDVVIDGVTGLTCGQRDSADLAGKIRSLLDDPGRAAQLGEAGRRHVEERFDWRNVARRYADLIDRLE